MRREPPAPMGREDRSGTWESYLRLRPRDSSTVTFTSTPQLARCTNLLPEDGPRKEASREPQVRLVPRVRREPPELQAPRERLVQPVLRVATLLPGRLE